ncbi:MAG: FAD-binding protein [Lachnospiraceae bacterium]|nr:FAD-binding protein [Lachnospiraceae bacterium]
MMQNKKQIPKSGGNGPTSSIWRNGDSLTADVLVMGAGLAGITAAIWAARTGARTAIASSSAICSGSSFYPGTWGLGLVGPENQEDERELAQTILQIGEGMADPELVNCLTAGIQDGIKELQALGVSLKEAVNKGEKEFIPCFDHKNRDWHGIVKESAGAALKAELQRLEVTQLPDTCITDLFMENGQISGVGAVQKGADGWKFLTIRCSSVVIASGGMGGLFSRCLNTSDVTGMGQFLALKAGASLVNLEFMQMMPGYLHPAPKTIYNEKAFQYSEFSDPRTGQSVFSDWSQEELKERLKIRSTHGPFTCRLGSGEVDVRLFQACLENPEGVRLTYRNELKEHQPEFVQTYFQWLKEEKGLTIDDPVQIGIFAHASNGGICIDSHGGCRVKGLYACGEATGGMHGADRLGGLSTANGLVFGKRAGIQAAKWSLENREDQKEQRRITGQDSETEVWKKTKHSENEKHCEVQACAQAWETGWIPGAQELIQQIRQINFRCAMVVRREETLVWGLEQLASIGAESERRRRPLSDKEEEQWDGSQPEQPDGLDMAGRYRMTRELEGTLRLSEAMLRAALMRKESRGSHYRADFPSLDHGFDHVILVRETQEGLAVLRHSAAMERNQDKEA